MPGLAPEEFDQFYDQHFIKVVHLLMRSGFRRENAEDAAQFAMIELHRHLADVHEPGAWVRAAAHRAACRAADRERRDSALRRMLAWTARPPVAPAADPGRGEPGEAARVRALLGRLGRTELAALAWDIDGFTVNETAEAFGLTVDEVTNARRRARAHLARLICTAAPDLWETIRQPAEGKD